MSFLAPTMTQDAVTKVTAKRRTLSSRCRRNADDFLKGKKVRARGVRYLIARAFLTRAFASFLAPDRRPRMRLVIAAGTRTSMKGTRASGIRLGCRNPPRTPGQSCRGRDQRVDAEGLTVLGLRQDASGQWRRGANYPLATGGGPSGVL